MPQISQGRGWVIANTSQTPLGGDRHDVVITELSDVELILFTTGGRNEVSDAELAVIASGGRIEDEMKVISPMPSKD